MMMATIMLGVYPGREERIREPAAVTYPIPTRRWSQRRPADLAVCERCGAEWHMTGEEIAEGDPYDRCLKHEGCGGQVHMKYLEVGACENCNRLGGVQIDGCCSQRCKAQRDHARALRAS